MTSLLEWNDIPDHIFEAFLQRIALVETLLDETIDRRSKDAARQAYIEKYRVSGQTIRRYMRKYKKQGPKGLMFVRAKDKAIRIKSDALREKIESLINELPSRSVPQLRRLVSNDEGLKHEIEAVSDRTIYRYLYENGLSHKERLNLMKDQSNRVYHSFEAPYSLALVQADARDGIWLIQPDGSKIKTFLFLWIDDYSRKILFGKYYTSEKLPFMEDSLKYMILRYGIPVRIYLDNGKVYVSKHFAFILASLSIKKLHHPPYQAHCKGKVERDMQVIKHQFQDEANLAGFVTVEELNTAFWAWCDICYNKMLHSQTGMSPDERFLSGLNKDRRRIKDLLWFNSLFLWRESRTVTKYGKVKLYSNEYPVTKMPPGKVVKILFDPFDLSSINIVDQENRLLETTSPHKKINTKVPNIPEEKKGTHKVSKDSYDFFVRLREQHMKMQKNENKIDFSVFNKTQNKEDDNE